MEEIPEQDIPEPELESYADCSIPELEAEIQALANDHLKDLGEIGPRVFWLNEKYKTSKKRKGTGAKQFCEQIEFDLNHWNYLVRKFSPPDIKEMRERQKEVKRLNKLGLFRTREESERLNKLSRSAYEAERPSDNQQPAQPVDEPAEKIENSINGLEDVRALVKERLASLSPSKQKKELTDLKEWIIGQLLDLEDEINSQQAA